MDRSPDVVLGSSESDAPAVDASRTPLPPDFPADVPLYPGAEHGSTSRKGQSVELVLRTRDAVDVVDAWYRRQSPFTEDHDGLFGGGGSPGTASIGDARLLFLQDDLARKLMVGVKPADDRTEITLVVLLGHGCADAEARARAGGDCQDILDPPPSTIAGRGIPLPPSTRRYREHTVAFQDSTTRVRFELAPSDLADLAARLPCRLGPPSTGDDIDMGADARRWYRPSASRRHRQCAHSEPGLHQKFLVDLTDEAQPVVYAVLDVH